MQNPQFAQAPFVVVPASNSEFLHGAHTHPQHRPVQVLATGCSQQSSCACSHQSKSSSQWKNIFLVVLAIAVVYVNYTWYKLDSYVASREFQIMSLNAKIDAMSLQHDERREVEKVASPSKVQTTAPPCQKKHVEDEQQTPVANDFFKFQAASDGETLMCNGTDICAALGGIINQQNQALAQAAQLNVSLEQLQVIVNQHAQDIAELINGSDPNKTKPNVTNWAFNKNINAAGYNINQIIQLQDGRIAAAANGNNGIPPSALLYDVNSGRLSRNLTILYSVNTIQSLVQLQDGRLLASAKNPSTNGGEFQVWNVTSGNIIQRIQFSFNMISLIQLESGNIVALTNQGNVSVFRTVSLYSPITTLKVQNTIVSQNPNQLVEIIVNSTSKLFVPVNTTAVGQIDTSSWTFDKNFSLGLATAQITAITYSSNETLTVLGNKNSNPLVLLLSNGSINATISTVAYSVGLVANGILATTSSSSNQLGIYDLATGTQLRTITDGMSANGYSIITIQGTINGFAVASYNLGVITIFNY